MGTDTLVQLLSGTTMLAPRLGRAGLSVLMAVRLAALAVGARALWQDEVGDVGCDATASCRLACFDSAFPVSPFSLFLLQAAVVSTHGLACSFLWHPPDCQGKGWLRDRTQQLRLHLLSVLARILLEAIFLGTFHALYTRYPPVLHCPPSTLCPNSVVCTIRNAQWKDTFNLFVAGISWACVAVCLVVLYFAVTKIVQLPLRPAKMHSEHPLLAECA
ncbi:gap junction beta-6 protein-like [Heteronotia binoei]|uniref:gap junction beta-6 protein-like n=1 Tax=Heteronotia binoei TaxID=13085 RepID=UPI002931172D|nr:gap junction beta-6 protein-like [Heteronotia binoei]XP_060089132.1 gap junction beta-6 protein-like [Heteronotia binoei]